MAILAKLTWLTRTQAYVALGVIIAAAMLGSWAGAVAAGKGRNMQVWFLIGFFFPIAGIIAAYIVRPKSGKNTV